MKAKWSVMIGSDSVMLLRGDEEFHARFDGMVTGTEKERRDKLDRVAQIITGELPEPLIPQPITDTN